MAFMVACCKQFQVQPNRVTIATLAFLTLGIVVDTGNAQSPAVPDDKTLSGEETLIILKRISWLRRIASFDRAAEYASVLCTAFPDDSDVVVLHDELKLKSQSSENVPPRRRTTYEELSGDDQLTLTLLSKRDQAMRNEADVQRQANAARELLTQIKSFNVSHKGVIRGWIIQANCAVALNKPIEGSTAAQNMLALGAAESINPSIINLLMQLDARGWITISHSEATSAQR